MDIQSVLQQLDSLFQRGEYAQVEDFMLDHIARAEAEGDKGAMLSLLNELMGYYRSTSRFKDSLAAASWLRAQALLRTPALMRIDSSSGTALALRMLKVRA